jgi:hypothetical protein
LLSTYQERLGWPSITGQATGLPSLPLFPDAVVFFAVPQDHKTNAKTTTPKPENLFNTIFELQCNACKITIMTEIGC